MTDRALAKQLFEAMRGAIPPDTALPHAQIDEIRAVATDVAEITLALMAPAPPEAHQHLQNELAIARLTMDQWAFVGHRKAQEALKETLVSVLENTGKVLLKILF